MRYGIALPVTNGLLILTLYPALMAAAIPTVTSVSPAAARAGDVIAINGSNFDPNPANNVVKFGKNRAAVTGAIAGQLTVVVPNGQPPGSTTITVTVHGQPAGSSNFLTFATQKIASVPANPGAGCVNVPVDHGGEGCTDNQDKQASPCAFARQELGGERGGLTANIYGERGEFFQFVTDLYIPGRPDAAPAVQLSVERQYRAAAMNSGAMGNKWNHKHFENLQIEPNGTVVHNNGLDRSDVYSVNNLGALVAPPEVYTLLTKNANGSYDLRYRDGTVKHFDAAGKLITATDRNNNGLSFTYNAQNQLQTVTDTLGRALTYAYNGAGQLTSVMDFGGRSVKYTYDAAGNLASVTSPAVTGTPNGNDFPAGKTTKYTYDSNHLLLTVTRPNEAAAGGPAMMKLAYDSAGRVTSLIYGGTNASGVAAGGTYTYTYTPLNAGVSSDDPNLPVMRTQQTDPNNNVAQYDYNRLGYPVAIREFTRGIRPGDPASYLTTLTYDADGRLTQKTLPEGNLIQYQYDEANPDRRQQGNMLSQTMLPDAARGGDQAFITITYTYEPAFNHIVTMTEARGNDPSYVPQNGGAQSPARYTTTFTYDAAGNLVKTQEPTVTLPGGATQAIETDYTYNAFGQMTSLTDPEGNVTQYQYCAAATPVCSTPDPNGGGYLQRTILDAVTSPRRIETAPPAQITTQLLYDQWGNVVESIDGRGNATVYTVNQLNQIVAAQAAAPYGYITYMYYDANDNIVRRDVQNQVAAVTPDNKPTFTSGNFAIAAGTPALFTYRYTYDILDNLVTDDEDATGSTPSRLVTQYRYDPNRNRIQITEPAGNVTAFQYDERNLRFKMTRGSGTPDASTTAYNYDLNRNLAAEVDGRGFTTAIQYDGFDRWVRTTDAVGGQRLAHYDPAGNMVSASVSGQPGGPSPANNSGAGNALLSLQTYEYDELNRRFQEDDQPVNGSSFVAAGVATSRPASIVPGPLNSPAISTQTLYDRNSRAIQRTEDDGGAYSTQYDGLNRMVLETDPAGNTIQYLYDNNNNVTQTLETDVSQVSGIPSESFTTQFVYDSLNRLTQETDNCSNVRHWAYDSRDNLTNDTDAKGDSAAGCSNPVNPQGNTTVYTYDGSGRWLTVSEDLRAGGVGSGAITGQISLSHAYDANGRLTAFTDGDGNVYRYLYDALNRVISEIFPDGTTKTYAYDPNSNTKTVVDNNGTASSNTYDNIDRLIQTAVTPAPGVIGTTANTYQYDGLYRRTLLTDNNNPADPSSASTVTFAYDSLGRVIEERQNGHAVDSGWTAQAQRTSLIYPNGRRLDFTNDLLERTRSIQDHGGSNSLAQYSYMGPGRVLVRNYQNGSRLTYLNAAGTADAGYDRLRRTVGRSDLQSNNSLIVGFNYTYDREYNKNFEAKLHQSQRSETYTYDSAYRLARFQRGPIGGTPAGSEQWTLDAAGNWLVDTVNGAPSTRTVNSLNEYTSINGAPLSYDKNGNLTGAALGYQWDYRNRLRQVCSLAAGASTCASPGAQLLATYSYDALDRRTRKVVASSGAITNFYYDGWTTIEERDASDTMTQQYVNGIDLDEPLALDNATGRYFYHQNALGSTFALTDASGNVIEGYEYNPYGKQTVLAPDFTTTLGNGMDSAVGNPFLFTGQRYDPESGLLYDKNRYYSPELGRFLSRDPVQLMDTDSLYAYVENRPTAWLDPLGLCQLVTKPGNKRVQGCPTLWLFTLNKNWTKEESELAGLSECDQRYGCTGDCNQTKKCDIASAEGAKRPQGAAPVALAVRTSKPGALLLAAGNALGTWRSIRCCCTCVDPAGAGNPQNGAQAGRGGNQGGGNGGGRGGQQGGGGRNGNGGANGNGAGGGGRGAGNPAGGALAGRGGNGNPGGASAGRGGSSNRGGGGAAAGRGGAVNVTVNVNVSVPAPAATAKTVSGQTARGSNTVIVINPAHAPSLPGGGRGSRDGLGGRGQ